MIHRIDDLWDSAAGEGASTPASIVATPTAAELDLLMDAWSHERHEKIEYRLLLDRTHRLLSRMLATGALAPRCQGKVKRLIAAIDAVEHSAGTEEL